MVSLFRDNLHTFRAYMGNGFLLLLFLAALIFLNFTEKSIRKRILMVYVPEVILVLFFLPPVRSLFSAVLDEGDTYYRLLWLIPMAVITCYAIVRASASHYRVGLVAGVAIIALTGSLVYKNQNVMKAQNAYHLPQHVIDIVDVIAPAEGENRVRAAFPSELVHFVRQYNTDILLAFGREMVEPQWDYYHPVYEVMEKPDEIVAHDLIEATRAQECRYIILNEARPIDRDLESYGFELLDTIAGYKIYEDLNLTR